ncbi:MAG: TIGR04086 family membrane protein [Bacilli bacterium]|nr:TIGR04086 family membrane protein [Bacilli bacterium]
MNKIINYIKSISLFLLIFIIYLLIISLISYFELLSFKTIGIINYIMILLLFFILGFKTSHLEQNKGYLNGFIVSLVLIIIFTIITLIIDKIDFSKLVYFLTLIASSVTGGIIGVNKKH